MGLTLSDIGSVASLVSLAVTGWVAIRVATIEKRFLVRARGPALLQRMADHSTRLSQFMSAKRV